MCIFFLFFQLWIYTYTIIHYNFYFNYINSFLIWQPQIKITIVLVLLLLLYAWNTNCICIITNKKNNKSIYQALNQDLWFLVLLVDFNLTNIFIIIIIDTTVETQSYTHEDRKERESSLWRREPKKSKSSIY